MNGIDLNDVATFVRVADGQGFTAAARALGVPKSTVSRSLARLERELGVRLLHRTTRALALTEAGRAYYARVREAVTGVAEATADVVDMGKEPRGTIRVTAPVDVGQALLADAVAGFAARYPQVRFELSLTSRVVDLVAEGFDLAVRASPLRDSSLVARRLGSAGMGLYASPAYLKRRGMPKTVGELALHEFIGFRMTATRGPLVLETDAQKERVSVTGAIEADDLLFVHRLIVTGAGIGLLPMFLPSRTWRSGREALTRVLPAWTLRGPALSLVAPSARHEPRRVKLFREFLLAEAKRLGFDGA
jgi:DNA-binding transcriptional LysR family regulator